MVSPPTCGHSTQRNTQPIGGICASLHRYATHFHNDRSDYLGFYKFVPNPDDLDDFLQQDGLPTVQNALQMPHVQHVLNLDLEKQHSMLKKFDEFH
jgi:hypothetical protein